MVARKLTNESFGLIFGINYFGATVIQTILTLIVVSDNLWTLHPRGQFLAYGIYFCAIGVIFFFAFLLKFAIMRKREKLVINLNK
jgi:hypothetical protein